MLLKKSIIILCSCGSLPSSKLCLPTSITSSSNSASTRPLSSLRRLRTIQTPVPSCWVTVNLRAYATVQDGARRPLPSENIADCSLPAWPTTKNPTPYEIFDQSKSAPYSKKKFYDLVKHYHPDRHIHYSLPSQNVLSSAAKLERYRLIVAANSILCDPVKRRAYDLYGAGWGEKTTMNNTAYREADRAWRQAPGSAANNATWEDWERWHAKRNGSEKQSPLYMSNGMFVAALAVFVVFGSWSQATRASSHSVHLLEMREHKHHDISEDMWRRKKEKELLSREDRIQNFIRQRDGWAQESANDSHLPKD